MQKSFINAKRPIWSALELVILINLLNRVEYDNLLVETNVKDHVPKESITFVSFPYDLDKAGNIMRSSLDGFLTSTRFADKNNVRIEIESTEQTTMNEDGNLKRPTDHFLMVAGINN